MDISPHVEALRQDLTRAAEVGGIEVEVAAERLLGALEPAMGLALMDLLSQAAAEISEQLPGVAIDVRLKGREPELTVTGAPPQPEPAPAAPADEPQDADADDGVTRITLRLPEALKTRAEALAASRGQSLNTWLVAAAKLAAAGQDGPR